MTERGIYVVAYGTPARQCAERLIASAHEFLPGVPVAVASDIPLAAADVSVIYPDEDLGGRTAKTLMYDLAPAEWEQVLYLDADTEIVADISFLFDALTDGWEMVITKDLDDYDAIHSLWRRDSLEYEAGWKALGSDQALQLAGGVVAFRRTRATKRFLKAWFTEWKVLARRDQGALLRALYKNPVHVLVLGNEWNSFTGLFEGVTAGILHHRGGPARRLQGWREGRLDDKEKWQHLVGGTRVHIICPETLPDRILFRMAKALTQDTGWTMSTTPDPRADLQYFFPYLAGAALGPFMSYFSHREDTVPQKSALWHSRAASKQLKLRIVTAPMYEEELSGYGPTLRIVPPLDRVKFCPVPAHAARQRPIAGVSGYVYQGGRKGEETLAQVLATATGQAFDWRACGAGWPVPTKRLPWAKLATFYQDLDVYVCTSIIEGVPYGPLEALACGVPVVIPRGVGLLDELPDLPGIIRYTAGDADDLVRALEVAQTVGRPAQDDLRDTTAQYTMEGWVHGHLEAVSSLAIAPSHKQQRVATARGWVWE